MTSTTVEFEPELSAYVCEAALLMLTGAASTIEVHARNLNPLDEPDDAVKRLSELEVAIDSISVYAGILNQLGYFVSADLKTSLTADAAVIADLVRAAIEGIVLRGAESADDLRADAERVEALERLCDQAQPVS